MPLPKPLQLTPYVPPSPKIEKDLPPNPPPRLKKTKVKLCDPRVQKLIEEITPFYTPEAIQEFRDKVNKRVAQAEGIKIIERKKALKNTVKSFEVENISFTKDPRMLFATIQNAISEKLAQLLKQKGPFKSATMIKFLIPIFLHFRTQQVFLKYLAKFQSTTNSITHVFWPWSGLRIGENDVIFLKIPHRLKL